MFPLYVMNLVQHLRKMAMLETLKQVQGDRLGNFLELLSPNSDKNDRLSPSGVSHHNQNVSITLPSPSQVSPDIF